MSVLTSKDRKNMPKSSFALPKEKAYPIENKSHARNALSRVSENGTPAQKQEVRAKVKEKFPSIGKQPDGYHDKAASATHTNGVLKSTDGTMDNWAD